MASPVDLAPLRAALDLDAKATPGEWYIRHGRDGESCFVIRDEAERDDLLITDNASHGTHANVAAVIALHNAAPALRAALDELERLRAVADALRADNAQLRKWLDENPGLPFHEIERMRATARRHASARAELFTAYLRASGDPTIREALRAFFEATEEP